MAIQTGRSYFSASRGDLSPSDPTKWVLPLSLLPTRYAPIEGQIRVVVGDTEYTYDDPNLLSRPTTNKWTYEERAFVPDAVQVRRVFVHAITKLATSGTFDNPSLKEVVYYDENGDRIPVGVDEVYGSSTDEGGPFAGTAPADAPEPAIGSPGGGWNFQNLYDLDDTTDGSFTPSGENRHHYVLFNVPKLISKVGFNGQDGGGSSGGAADVEIWLDIGTSSDPEWVQVVNETGLTNGDYPNTSTPIDPDTMMREVDLPAAILGAVPFPTITIDPAPDNLSDKVTLFRETRQDRPWVRPYGGARASGKSLHFFWTQLLYIYQEMCELSDLAALTGLPIAEPVTNPFVGASIVDAGGTSRSTISYAELELLEGIPGAPIDPIDQLIVELGDQTDGSSTIWTPTTFVILDASAKTLQLQSGGGANPTSLDVRVRRSTKIDALWVDIETTGPIGWNSAVVTLLQKQMRFLREEACLLPRFYEGHVLTNSIFPRAWNYLTFVGAGATFRFGGPSWGGDGAIVVYQNDLPLVEGTDYEIVWPGIVLNTPQGATDELVIGGGGGGGWGGVNLPGGDTEPDDVPVTPSGDTAPIEIEWPGLTLPPNLGFTVSVGSTPNTALANSNTWEGSSGVSFTQGNIGSDPFTDHCMRVQVTRTTGNDSELGSFNEDATEIVYLNKYCGLGRLRAVAAAWDSTGGGSYASDVGSAALGCADSGFGLGADAGLGLVAAAMATVNIGSAQSPVLNMAIAATSAMDGPLVANNINNIPLINAWEELTTQSVEAAAAGVVLSSGFTGQQFEDYLDPDVDFDEFDIPVPP